uniref:Uncharacterized protein n=1 Tax=Oryza punctata TaxID=4537 RepID=A0A0E0LPA9_ORYPU
MVSPCRFASRGGAHLAMCGAGDGGARPSTSPPPAALMLLLGPIASSARVAPSTMSQVYPAVWLKGCYK